MQGLRQAKHSGAGSVSSSFISIFFFAILAFRFLKAEVLWRLRNPLIVTYMFIGVVPTLLLIGMTFVTLYLLAGQFANFVVVSRPLADRARGIGELSDCKRVGGTAGSWRGADGCTAREPAQDRRNLEHGMFAHGTEPSRFPCAATRRALLHFRSPCS